MRKKMATQECKHEKERDKGDKDTKKTAERTRGHSNSNSAGNIKSEERGRTTTDHNVEQVERTTRQTEKRCKRARTWLK